MDSLRQSIERLLRKHGRGYAFTRKDLRDLASTGTLGRVLARMAQVGRDAVDQNVVLHLRHALSSRERRQLANDTRYGTDWIHEVAKQIAKDD